MDLSAIQRARERARFCHGKARRDSHCGLRIADCGLGEDMEGRIGGRVEGRWVSVWDGFGTDSAFVSLTLKVDGPGAANYAKLRQITVGKSSWRRSRRDKMAQAQAAIQAIPGSSRLFQVKKIRSDNDNEDIENAECRVQSATENRRWMPAFAKATASQARVRHGGACFALRAGAASKGWQWWRADQARSPHPGPLPQAGEGKPPSPRLRWAGPSPRLPPSRYARRDESGSQQ